VQRDTRNGHSQCPRHLGINAQPASGVDRIRALKII
jgi:hypothetical protein